jgi:RNA polymerase sigma-70 factor (ECF subfamily)
MDTAGPDELVENRMVLNEILAAAKTLPEAQRQVIALRFSAGLSVAETAKAMGKGEGNVKVIQHKAIAKLREMMGQPKRSKVKVVYESEQA